MLWPSPLAARRKNRLLLRLPLLKLLPLPPPLPLLKLLPLTLPSPPKALLLLLTLPSRLKLLLPPTRSNLGVAVRKTGPLGRFFFVRKL